MVIGIYLDGIKMFLESALARMSMLNGHVLNELKNHKIQNILIMSVDNLRALQRPFQHVIQRQRFRSVSSKNPNSIKHVSIRILRELQLN